MKHLLPAVLLPAALLLVLSACADAPPDAASADPGGAPALASRADSVAWRALQSAGGPGALGALRYLRFDFAVDREGERQPIARHLWDRHTGAYRVEWDAAPDSQYVVLFDVDDRTGRAYMNGQPVPDAQRQPLLDRAYERHINDAYWLLAPTKLLDEGVRREWVADSSGGAHDVLRLTFDGVGLTPGDTYWHWIDRETGRVDRWAYVLESAPDAPPRAYDWTGWETLDTPEGPVRLATRKAAVGRPLALLTDALEAPEDVPAELWEDPQPRLR